MDQKRIGPSPLMSLRSPKYCWHALDLVLMLDTAGPTQVQPQ